MSAYLDYIVIILGTLVMISFVVLLIRGKRMTSNKWGRYIPLILVFASFLSILLLNLYYERLLTQEINKFQNIQNRILSHGYDSLSLTKQEKNLILDSLRSAEKELDEILLRIQKQEKIIGDKSNLIENVKKIMNETGNIIYGIETYNEILPNNMYNRNRKGFTKSNNTSAFIFQPPLNTSGEYLDFIIKFHDENLINKIAVIYLKVYKKHKEDNNITHIYEQYYKPQKGVNAFRIKNYLTQENTELLIGFFWKNEFGKNDYPNFECITYSLKP